MAENIVTLVDEGQGNKIYRIVTLSAGSPLVRVRRTDPRYYSVEVWMSDGWAPLLGGSGDDDQAIARAAKVLG